MLGAIEIGNRRRASSTRRPAQRKAHPEYARSLSSSHPSPPAPITSTGMPARAFFRPALGEKTPHARVQVSLPRRDGRRRRTSRSSSNSCWPIFLPPSPPPRSMVTLTAISMGLTEPDYFGRWGAVCRGSASRRAGGRFNQSPNSSLSFWFDLHTSPLPTHRSNANGRESSQMRALNNCSYPNRSKG